jgi:hypothetical protein
MNFGRGIRLVRGSRKTEKDKVSNISKGYAIFGMDLK